MERLGDYLSIKQAAELSGYSERYIRDLWRTEKIEGMKVGTMIFINEPSLEAYTEIASEKSKNDSRYKNTSEG
jgi:excisionase family DNA binding protein